ALQASGGDIWNTADGMHFFYRTLTGDGEIVARVLSVGNTDFWAKAGVMIRESLDPGARNAFMLETPHDVSPAHDEPVFQWRSTTGGLTSDSGNHMNGIQAAPVWLRLVRQGNRFSGYRSMDGVTWIQVGPTVTLTMTTDVFVGLALTAHNNTGVLNTSMF